MAGGAEGEGVGAGATGMRPVLRSTRSAARAVAERRRGLQVWETLLLLWLLFCLLLFIYFCFIPLRVVCAGSSRVYLPMPTPTPGSTVPTRPDVISRFVDGASSRRDGSRHSYRMYIPLYVYRAPYLFAVSYVFFAYVRVPSPSRSRRGIGSVGG